MDRGSELVGGRSRKASAEIVDCRQRDPFDVFSIDNSKMARDVRFILCPSGLYNECDVLPADFSNYLNRKDIILRTLSLNYMRG